MARRNKQTGKWYVATLLLVTKEKDQTSGPWTIEEQTRVLVATDEEAAYRKAMSLGKKVEQEETEDAEGEEERFMTDFLGLLDLAELRDKHIQDGTTIKFDIYEDDNPPSERVTPKEHLSVFVPKQFAKMVRALPEEEQRVILENLAKLK